MTTKLFSTGACVCLTACLFAAGLALAQTAAPAAKPPGDASPGLRAMFLHPPAFEDLDANHDGIVSKAEFDAYRTAHPMPGRPGMWPDGPPRGRFAPPFDLQAADTNHDGKISWAEFQAAATAR